MRLASSLRHGVRCRRFCRSPAFYPRRGLQQVSFSACGHKTAWLLLVAPVLYRSTCSSSSRLPSCGLRDMSSNNPGENEASPEDVEKLDQLVEKLSLDPAFERIASETAVLQSIYGENSNDSIRIWRSNGNGGYSQEDSSGHSDDKAVRYEVQLGLPPPHDSPDNVLRVLVSVPRTYPESSPPQFQLLSRYIGSFSVDADLFGSVLRTFISSRDGIEWTPGTECVFDGLENVRDRIAVWYSDRLSEEKVHELVREYEKEKVQQSESLKGIHRGSSVGTSSEELQSKESLPEDFTITIAEPIEDRKSVFIGRACRISHPSQVPIVLSHLVSNKRIARAAHPVIHAWRCRLSGSLYQDNDDDGESAAGGRLAHLLQILDVENVLVIVTRYFGGTLLGPDRFKHINQAARNALELGGFLNAPKERKTSSRLKKKK